MAVRKCNEHHKRKYEMLGLGLTLSAVLAWGTTVQGWGRSRNTASAVSVRSNPSAHTSLTIS